MYIHYIYLYLWYIVPEVAQALVGLPPEQKRREQHAVVAGADLDGVRDDVSRLGLCVCVYVCMHAYNACMHAM